MKKITVEVSDEVYALLEVLTKGDSWRAEETVEGVVEELIDHAQQGVYRPCAWERDWLAQVFGEDFVQYLEPDGVFQRPKKVA